MSRALVPVGRAGGRYVAHDSDSELEFDLSEDEESRGPSPGTWPDGLEGSVATTAEFFSSVRVSRHPSLKMEREHRWG